MKVNQNKPIVFFDGICNLCNSFVNILLKIDKHNRFYVASLQGETASKKIPNQISQRDSVILLEGDKIFFESDAVLRIFTICGGIWKIFAVFKLIPRKIRDKIYNWVASKRYKWFGKRNTCRMPTQKEKDKFLE